MRTARLLETGETACMVEDGEVEVGSTAVLLLVLYVTLGCLVLVLFGVREALRRRRRPRGRIYRKGRDEGVLAMSSNDEHSINGSQGGPRRGKTLHELPTQATSMAIKRLLFQKMNRGMVDEEGGYVEEGTLKKKSGGSRNSWETEYRKIKFKKKIGAGNFGEVWAGTWMQSTVAIKTVLKSMADNQEFVDSFINEIKLMSELNHPNIVMFLGAVVNQPRSLCLILEYCVHGNLIEFLQNGKEQEVNISMHLILKMALDIARGIKYLHEKVNIIQRDIKGRNVLVDENFNAKLSDFGLSRLRKEEDDAGLTACGTPAWTAPEVVRMEEYTEKVDVYSFGVVLWELVMRQEPYQGEGGIQIAYAAAEQGLRPPVPQFAPERYCLLMQECWADSPDDRPHFSAILERLFQMMKDESNPFKAAEFYFGTRKHDYDPDLDVLLDDNELDNQLFGEDFASILQERKEVTPPVSANVFGIRQSARKSLLPDTILQSSSASMKEKVAPLLPESPEPDVDTPEPGAPEPDKAPLGGAVAAAPGGADAAEAKTGCHPPDDARRPPVL